MGALWWCEFYFSWWEEKWGSRRNKEELLEFLFPACGRWGPADIDGVRQGTYIELSLGRRRVSWSRVWFTIPVSLISALFILLSQSFISIFIPHSLILQYIPCDGIGCSNDSLWGKPITEYSSSYWYQKTVEWTSVLHSSLHTVENLGKQPSTSKKVQWKIKYNEENAVLAAHLTFILILVHKTANMWAVVGAAQQLNHWSMTANEHGRSSALFASRQRDALSWELFFSCFCQKRTGAFIETNCLWAQLTTIDYS